MFDSPSCCWKPIWKKRNDYKGTPAISRPGSDKFSSSYFTEKEWRLSPSRWRKDDGNIGGWCWHLEGKYNTFQYKPDQSAAWYPQTFATSPSRQHVDSRRDIFFFPPLFCVCLINCGWGKTPTVQIVLLAQPLVESLLLRLRLFMALCCHYYYFSLSFPASTYFKLYCSCESSSHCQ